MAPEVLRGDAPSERSDVWSFGCVVHELLTGSPPFGGATMPALASAIRDAAAAPLPASVPPGVRLLVTRCLSKEPLERYRDGSELARAFHAVAEIEEPKDDDRVVVTATVSGRHAAVAPEGYALYQRGQALFWRGTRRDLEAAVQLFSQAATLAPQPALAHAALAHACGRIHRFCDRDEKWLHRGLAAAQRALTLQPRLAEAFAATAYLHYAHEEYEEALRVAHLALAQKEDCDTVYATLGYTFYMLGRFEGAAALVDRALETSGHDFSVYIPLATCFDDSDKRRRRHFSTTNSAACWSGRSRGRLTTCGRACCSR